MVDPHPDGMDGSQGIGGLIGKLAEPERPGTPGPSVHNPFETRLYPPFDDADKETCRPDLAVALYLGHLAVPEKSFALNPELHVTARTAPTFLLHVEDDPVDPVENLLVYDAALRKAGVPAEVHILFEGGHAFGLRATDAPITHWAGLVERWLESASVLSK